MGLISITTILGILIFLYSVILHEISHGLMAQSLGDNTAKDMGRITLNPIRHLDFFGSIILPLLLIISHVGFIFGYAKPVPYNPQNLRDKKYGPAKVAFAGPASNLILGVLFGLVLRLDNFIYISTTVQELIKYAAVINIWLAIFNLFPIPPLDGHWLLMTFLPAKFNGLKVFLYRYNIALLLIFILFVTPFLSYFVGWFLGIITGINFLI